ncbi:MAG: PilZ domain-containing protein [Candidatus Omnitrophota bacterium]
MSYPGVERRKHPRVNGRFVVSYRVYEEIDNIDISQTKNVSLGGMLLTTNRKFHPGTLLAIEIRLPFVSEKIHLIAKVLESKEIIKDLIYDTRLNFIEFNDVCKKALDETVAYYLKKKS